MHTTTCIVWMGKNFLFLSFAKYEDNTATNDDNDDDIDDDIALWEETELNKPSEEKA